MQVIIPKITLGVFEGFGDSELEKEYDMQENAVNNAWDVVYSNIASGKYNIAYWDAFHHYNHGYSSFMRYVLHKSTKQDGLLQLSVMEIQNGNIIPTSDSQHKGIETFLRRVIGFDGKEITIK